jgi:hypothetical protein
VAMLIGIALALVVTAFRRKPAPSA